MVYKLWAKVASQKGSGIQLQNQVMRLNLNYQMTNIGWEVHAVVICGICSVALIFNVSGRYKNSQWHDQRW